MIREHLAKDGKTKTYGVRVNVGGKKVWVGTFSDRKAARDAEALAILKADKQPRPTVERFYDEFMGRYERQNKASSALTAKAAIKGFVDDFGHRHLNTITDAEALKWARENEWRVNAVLTFMNAAVKKGHIDRNPFSGLGKKGHGRRDLEPLTPEEVDRLAGCAKSLGKYAPTMKALVLFAAYTGMRESELFGLEWRDIDLKEGRVRVERQWSHGRFSLPKANKPRLISLTPPARDALLALPRSPEIVFPARRGGRLSTSNFVGTYWPSVCAAFGRKVHFHELRHFCGHHLYVRMDLPSRVVAAQLGHSGPTMVEQLYGHFRVGALDEIDRAFGNVTRLRVAGAANESA